MTKTFRTRFFHRAGNVLFVILLRAGMPAGPCSLLTVRGRKSGQPHTVPFIPIEQDGQRWLVAPYGVVQWVRNLRTARTATLTHNRRSEHISVTELDNREAAPVLKQYLMQIGIVRPYFDVTKDALLSTFESEAPRHPVFQITPVNDQGKRR